MTQNKVDIVCTGRQEGELADEIIQAMVAVNRPPTLFHRKSTLMGANIDPTGELDYKPDMDLRSFRFWINDKMNFHHNGRNGLEPSKVDQQVLNSIHGYAPWYGLPILRDVITDPVFRADGTILAKNGFDPDTRLFCHLRKKSFIRGSERDAQCVSYEPSEEEIAEAKSVLLTEVLGDFYFETEADLANAVAMFISHSIRYMVDEPLPLFILDATNQSSGKGTLASCIAIAWGGRGAVSSLPDDETELEKRVLGILMETEPVVIWDNVEHTVESATLAALLTSTEFSGRKLGGSAFLTLPNNKLWIMTGNNVALGKDLPRRTVWVRQDPPVDPKKRTSRDFRHPDLPLWVLQNRDWIQWSCMTLVQAWIVAGSPPPEVRPPVISIASRWGEIVAGILEFSGVPGFLGNHQARLDDDSGSASLALFNDQILRVFGTNIWRAKDIIDLCVAGDEELTAALSDRVLRLYRGGIGAQSATKTLGKDLKRGSGQFDKHGRRYVLCAMGKSDILHYKMEVYT